MDGIIFDVKRFAVHDGPGIRTTVFFKGCPLHCLWCHNPESIDPMPVCIETISKLNGREYPDIKEIGYQTGAEELLSELQKEQVFMDESGGGVTFSGGEPLLQHKFLIEMLKLCKTYGIHTTIDTTLYAGWEIISRTLEWTDLFLIDLKLMDDMLHQKYTGVSNQIVLENIRKLSERGSSFRIRIPMIPEISTTLENVKQSIVFLKELPNPPEGIDLLPFHNTAKEKYKRFNMDNYFVNCHSLPKEELTGIKTQFEEAGFEVKIGG
jgi:pyruvate formate lyase activating enzyme